MIDKVVEETIRKYTPEASGEEIQPAEVKARLSALEENADDSITVHLLVDRISASAKTPIKAEYGNPNEIWSNMAVRPSGDWNVSFRLENREVANSLAGLARMAEEVIRLNIESHRMVMVIENQEKPVGRVPGADVKFSR